MHDKLWGYYMKIIHSAGIGDADAWAKLDLTMPQMKVLMLLKAREESSVSTLAEVLTTSLPNMTGILDRLELQGLIERVHSANDRRSVNVRLTTQAVEIFNQLSQSGYEKFSRVLDQMTDSEQKMIELGLQILSDAFDKDQTRKIDK